MIEIRSLLDDIEVDIAANCRLFSRVRKDAGVWRLASLDCIYEKDRLAATNPSVRLEIDEDRLRTYRPSYRFLCYTTHAVGRSPRLDLPGDDRPDLVANLYAEAEMWLMAA